MKRIEAPTQGPYKVDKLGSPEGEYWYTVVDANGRKATSLAMHEPRADLMAYALNAAWLSGRSSLTNQRYKQIIEAAEYIRDHARSTSPELLSKYAEDIIAALSIGEGSGEGTEQYEKALAEKFAHELGDAASESGPRSPLYLAEDGEDAASIAIAEPSPTTCHFNTHYFMYPGGVIPDGWVCECGKSKYFDPTAPQL